MPLISFNKTIITISLLLAALTNYAQVKIEGTISSDTGLPLPFATVYEEGSTNGTTCNAEGNYQLVLTPGTHSIVAQHIGYKKQVQQVTIASSTTTPKLNFTLEAETLVLREVVINANSRDPSRSIIRKAIQRRKFYAKEVNAYSCEVYIKGLQRLDKRPDRILGMTITVDTGIVYLSESISKLKFEQPNRINEVMISSKVSGNNNAFSYNQASDILINLYENTFYVDGLSEREFVSPLSNSAFIYYDYKLAGTFYEDSVLIHKIQIIPKRDTDPVFSGYIYIMEDTWRIHSVDVAITKANGIEFVDSLTFNQIFAPVDHNIWMPISQRFTFNFKVFGFEGSGHFTAIYRDYIVEPNYELIGKDEERKAIIPPEEKKKDLFTKKDFTNAVVVVEEGANEKDSTYWKDVRPIPLTPFEVKDYHVKDSIRTIKESRPYKDSVDEVQNKFKPANLLLNGYTYFNSYEERYINFPTLLEGVQYNAIEGLALNLEFSYQKRNKRMTSYQIRPGLRYGFSNQKIQAKIEGFKRFDQKKSESLFGGLGRYIYQVNESEPIKGFDNSYFTLFEGKNFARFYQKAFVDIGYQREIINGLRLTGLLAYAYREPMRITASYNFSDRAFEPNIPLSREESAEGSSAKPFTPHRSITFTTNLRIRFAQKYIERPDRKINLQSKYPELNIVYKKGVPAFGSEINYDLLKVGANYEWRIGLLGTSQLSAWAGDFLTKKEIYLLDFEHFNGNQTYLRQLDGDDLFQLLDYYEFSTSDRFMEAHYEHHFNEFIFNKIPLIKRLNLQAVGSINYLTTPTAGQYVEFGAGIEHIFKFLRVDYFTAIRNGNHYGSGIRVGAGF